MSAEILTPAGGAPVARARLELADRLLVVLVVIVLRLALPAVLAL
jgi:hypothetical protein